MRLARLDLVGRRSQVWCEARLSGFAEDFDGSQWVIAREQSVFLIDALEPSFEALASFDMDAFVMAIGRSASSCTLLKNEMTGPTRVRFELPSWTLRASKLLEARSPGGPIHGVSAASATTAAWLAQPAPEEGSVPPQLFVARDGVADRAASLAWPRGAVAHAVSTRGGWIACAVHTAAGIEIQLVDEAGLAARAQIALGGATRAALRLSDDTLTIADDRGRVLVVDLAYGSVVQDLRV